MSSQFDVLFCVARDHGSAAALDPLKNQYEPILQAVSSDADIARANLSAIQNRDPNTKYAVLQGVVKWQPIADAKPGKKAKRKVKR